MPLNLSQTVLNYMYIVGLRIGQFDQYNMYIDTFRYIIRYFTCDYATKINLCFPGIIIQST